MDGKVYVLVLNWKQWRFTVQCLESVFQSDYPDYQVVFIDNNSADGSVEKVVEWAEGRIEAGSDFTSHNTSGKPVPYIRYTRQEAVSGGDPSGERGLCSGDYRACPLVIIENEVGLGYAGGNKVGMDYVRAKGDAAFIWVLNNDTVVQRDSMSALRAGLADDPEAGIAGSKLLYYDMPDTIQAAGGGSITPWLGNTYHAGTRQKDGPEWDTLSHPDYVTGASLFIEAGLAAELDSFEPRYFLGWEDADICHRARLKGRACLYCPDSVVWHRESATMGRASALSDYYWVRNGLMFTRRFYPFYLPLVLLSYLMKYTVFRLLRSQPFNSGSAARGMLDFLMGRKGPAK